MIIHPIQDSCYRSIDHETFKQIEFQNALKGMAVILIITKIASLIFTKLIASFIFQIPFLFGICLWKLSSVHIPSFAQYNRKIIEWDYKHPYLVNFCIIIASVALFSLPKIGSIALIIIGIFKGYLWALDKIKK